MRERERARCHGFSKNKEHVNSFLSFRLPAQEKGIYESIIIIMLRSSRQILSASCKQMFAIRPQHSAARLLYLHAARPHLPARKIPSSAALASWNRFKSTATMAEEDKQTMTPFLLADIGEGIAEVEILQWFVEAGEEVKQFDRICEVQSDKATVEITSRYDGRIASLEYQVGEMAKVGLPLLFLETDDDGIENQDSDRVIMEEFKEEEPLQIPTIASQFQLSADDENLSPPQTKGKVQTTPAIRKMSKEHNLDLSTIVGTGPKGRVLKGDVLTVLRERGLVQPPATSPTMNTKMSVAQSSTKVSTNVDSSDPPSVITSIDQASLPLQDDTILELRGYNRLMVKSMVASLQIPHMVYADELDLTQLMIHKQSLPFLPYLCKAVSKALAEYPVLNSSFIAESNSVHLHKDHNLGIAMDTPRGLIAPVIAQAQNKTIAEIQEELKRLKELAQNGTVPSQDLQGATFTISNIGAIGGNGTYMSPIVTPPQVAIGAFGKIQRLPRFVSPDSNQVEEARICTVSWAGDHRVVDGATMARFHGQVKQYMQDPISILKDCR
jgi:2-oxoisovalerate dehydrogenase E2 component (dihydrolipoyl transacylase)